MQNDLVSLKGFKIIHCTARIQRDGHNCGVIALKVCNAFTYSKSRNVHKYLTFVFLLHLRMTVIYKSYMCKN